MESPPKPVVLVVEDETLIRMDVADCLSRQCYRVLEAADARAAIDLLNADARIDVVFTDIQMPGPMNGFALAKWIDENHPGLPVILTSGAAAAVRRAQTLGIPSLVPKPYDPKELCAQIATALRNVRSGR